MMISPEECSEVSRQEISGARSKRCFSSVTRMVMSPELGLAGGRREFGIFSAMAPAANPAVDILRKSRLVLCLDIFLSHKQTSLEIDLLNHFPVKYLVL